MGNVIVANNGILRFSKTMNTRLALQHKNLTIGGSGTSGSLIIGDSDEDYLPKEYTAIVEWATTSDNAMGLVITNSYPAFNKISIHGDPNFFGNVLSSSLTSDWSSGSTFTVSGDLTNKWRIGNQLILQNIEDYPPSGAPQTLASKLKLVTISNVVLNGSNTDITVSEAWANLFLSGALVTNLSRNIIFRKVNANTTLGNLNAVRPKITGNYSYSNADVSSEVTNASFIGFYQITSTYLVFKKCVFRNGYYGLYDAPYNYVIDDLQKGIVHFLSEIINECVFFALQYPLSNGGGSRIDAVNSQFIANVYVTEQTGNMNFSNCKFIANNIASFSCRQMRFYDCDFIQNGYSVYRSTNMEYYNCLHYKQNRLCNRGGPYLFKRNYMGCNRNEVLEAALWDRYGEVHNLYGSDVSMDECIGGFWLYGPDGGFSTLKLRNNRNLDTPGPDDDWIQIYQTDVGLWDANSSGNGRVVGVYFCRKDTEHYVANDSQKLKMLQPSLYGMVFDLIKITEKNVKVGLQKRKIFIKTQYLIEWSATGLYLEVEYLNSSSTWSTAKIQSTQTPTANDEWTELSVEFNQSRMGDITYKLRLAEKPIVEYTYTWSEDYGGYWIVDYNNPILFVDSAIWVSDTQYVKIPWSLGDWESSFSIPDIPAIIDVRKDVLYNENQMAGALIVPSQDDVRDGVEVDDPYSVGNLELPVIADVKKDVSYGSNGTELTGTFVPTYVGEIIDVDIDIE
jgi:hypothetical protein